MPFLGKSLVVQWLGLHLSAEGPGLILNGELRSSCHGMVKNNKNKNHFKECLSNLSNKVRFFSRCKPSSYKVHVLCCIYYMQFYTHLGNY